MVEAKHRYVGQELDLFAKALRWKAYWVSQVLPFLGGHVLEVGAGIGANTRMLRQAPHSRWVCLEPDPTLAKRIQEQNGEKWDVAPPEVVTGTIQDLSDEEQFDAIVYIDVLEHIENDTVEIKRAGEHLKAEGSLIILSPAHPFLYSEFDESIGHFRRYTKKSLAALAPKTLHLERLTYLDSVGLLASLGNRLLLRKSLPTERQIAIWDGIMVPCSRILDPITFHRLGKSILAVWKRQQ